MSPSSDRNRNKESNPAKLAESFAKALETAHREFAPYQPTIALLSEQIRKLQDAGLEHVGLILATFDQLVSKNLPTPASPAPHCILSIYDAHFMIRLLPEKTIELYQNNLRSHGDNAGHAYKLNLSQEEQLEDFMTIVVETAATLSAKYALREYDVKPTDMERIHKSSPAAFKNL